MCNAGKDVEHMAEVKDIMNDLYLTYKKYKADRNMKAYNNRMGELAEKYAGDNFYTNMALAFASRINEENGH